MVYDEVERPLHYVRGDIECIDVIRAILSRDGYIGYLKGNIIKYLFRESEKGGIVDLEKAEWYLSRLIDELG